MKITFRVNNRIAKYCVGKYGKPEEWLGSLKKYLSDDAILELAIFTHKLNFDASLKIIDGKNRYLAKANDEEMANAIDSVVSKCTKQIVKASAKSNSYNDTIRYNDEFNVSFEGIDEEIELNPSTEDAFLLVETEENLAKMKKTSRYNRTMNRYISYLYRNNQITQAYDHLRILYSILDSINEEEMTVADYRRLCASIVELEKEVTRLSKKQATFENSVKIQEYISDVYEKEAAYAKLKSMK